MTAKQAAESPDAALIARFEELMQEVKLSYDHCGTLCAGVR